MSFLEKEELLTRGELIEEVSEKITSQLWASDNCLLMEVANLVGVEVTDLEEGGLFWKRIN